MGKKIFKAESRGYFDYGWLRTNHSFSFAKYHDPQRTNFGVLRVLNDDTVVGGKGFGKHPHDNMEIISIPLSGSLAHEDSSGHKQLIRKNDVQVMSAGSGLMHSELTVLKAMKLIFYNFGFFRMLKDMNLAMIKKALTRLIDKTGFKQLFLQGEVKRLYG